MTEGQLGEGQQPEVQPETQPPPDAGDSETEAPPVHYQSSYVGEEIPETTEEEKEQEQASDG